MEIFASIKFRDFVVKSSVFIFASTIFRESYNSQDVNTRNMTFNIIHEMLIPEIWLFKGVKAEIGVIPVYLLFRYRSIYLYIFVSRLINFLWKKIFKHLYLFIYRTGYI